MKPELPSLSLYERSVFIHLHAFTKLKKKKKKKKIWSKNVRFGSYEDYYLLVRDAAVWQIVTDVSKASTASIFRVEFLKREAEYSSDFCSGGAWFEFWLGPQLSWRKYFVIFPQSIQANLGRVPQLGNSRFIPNPFQFIINLSVTAVWSTILKVSWNNARHPPLRTYQTTWHHMPPPWMVKQPFLSHSLP
jgi:hypothetical protein